MESIALNVRLRPREASTLIEFQADITVVRPTTLNPT
jgi:hypothetical protein